MTGFELKLWRRGWGWTQERAAEEFGISLATYKRYEKKNPPKVVELAIRHLSFNSMYAELKKMERDHILSRLATLL